MGRKRGNIWNYFSTKHTVIDGKPKHIYKCSFCKTEYTFNNPTKFRKHLDQCFFNTIVSYFNQNQSHRHLVWPSNRELRARLSFIKLDCIQ